MPRPVEVDPPGPDLESRICHGVPTRGAQCLRKLIGHLEFEQRQWYLTPPGRKRNPAEASAIAQAQKILAPYVGRPTNFPVATPLKAAPTATTRIGYLDCSTPICGLLLQILQRAARTAGVSLVSVNGGSTASTVE